MPITDRRALVFSIAVLALVGCTGDEPVDTSPRPGEVVLFDWAESWDLVEIDRQVAEIDFGTATGRQHLGDGWSWDEATADGATFVWSTGPESTVRFHRVGHDPEVSVVARLWPFAFPEAPPQALVWRLDGTELARTDVPPGPTEVRVELGAVDDGAHRLTVEPAWHREVRAVLGGDDPRSLAVAWDRLRFEGDGAATAEPRADDDTVALPGGTALSAYLDPGVDRRLVIDALSVRDGDGLLVATVEQDDEPRHLFPIQGVEGGRSISIDLPDVEKPARLALQLAGSGVAVMQRLRVLGPAAAPIAETPPPSEPAQAKNPVQPKNVVLYVIDTLRVDRLGAYGHDRPTSPRLDALAEQGIVFERAMAQSSWTKSTMASMLTGLGPLRHGIRGPEHRLGDDAATLAEIFSGAGWWTAAASTNAHLTVESGFAQGFDVFEMRFADAENTADSVTDWGLSQLDTRPVDRPFFLWLHVIEPHAPYAPPQAERRRFAASVDDPWLGSVEHVRALGDKKAPATDQVVEALFDLYDAEIAATDRALGTFLDGLAERGLADDTIVIVIADHGEAFREREVFGHGWDLHAEVLHVPFVMRIPGTAPTRIIDAVQQVDLPPTLLDLVGVQAPPDADWDGTSLVPRLAGASLPPRPIVATMDYEGRAGLAIIHGDFKLIVPRSNDFGPVRLYDITNDPEETQNLVDRYPVLAGWLESQLRRAEQTTTEAATVELDPETRERLEALGYL